MSKFALECPHCGTVNKASTFFFSKKTISCGNCKNDIDVKANRMAIGTCSNCGTVAFDRAKGKCPVCNSRIACDESSKSYSLEDLKERSTTPFFDCPECGCYVQASKQFGKLVCPACDYKFKGYEEIYSQIQKAKLVSSNGVSVIKYEGGNDVFAWKHPIEDFNLGSQLIVHESQEAIFFLNGQALDLFGPGRYTLETENLPVLNKIYDLPTGKQNPFHAEVYFINKTVHMSIRWGTDSRVNFTDPKTGISFSIGASGVLNLQVADSRRFLVELVGNQKSVSWDSDSSGFAKSLKAAFMPIISTVVRTYLAKFIQEWEINILEIDTKLEELSNKLGEKLSPSFEEYGLRVRQFLINNVSLPDDDPNFKAIKDLIAKQYLGVKGAEIATTIVIAEGTTEIERAKIEAEKQRIAAQGKADATTIIGNATIGLKRESGLAEATIMDAKGYSQKDVLNTEVQKAMYSGMSQMGSGGGNGGIVSDMVGLTMGMAVAGNMSNKVTEMMNNTQSNDKLASSGTWKCSCGCDSNTGSFCQSCGSPKVKPDTVSWECPKCKAKNNGKFCNECGTKRPEAPSTWDCSCGTKGITSKCCPECGAKRPDAPSTWDCTCGAKGITSKCCPECGAKRPEAPSTWDCTCGAKGITSKCCPECGAKRPEAPSTWDCSCGTKGITSKFCPECGQPKEV